MRKQRQQGRGAWLLTSALSVLLVGAGSAPGAEDVPSSTEISAAIDRHLEAGWKSRQLTPAPGISDAAFQRRVTLDLVGRIPTLAEMSTFAADPRPERRAAWVDRLLASPEHARHLRDVFDVVFIGRKLESGRRRGQGADASGGRARWQNYLEQSFAANKPWNQLVRELLLARPTGESDRGAVWFLYDRQDKHQEIAEAVSPSLFGVQIACAQCHDHPQAEEIKQAHYWGLVAFFNRGKNANGKSGPRVDESAVGGFSRFATLTGESHAAELTFLGADPVPETRPAEGAKEEDKPELYRTPSPTEPQSEGKLPLFSRREKFVERYVEGNPLVARAAVNRFWALLMGRGLVHPVDKMDSRHPASHPELLDWLTTDFIKNGFNPRRLIRGLVLSRAYQLDSVTPEGAQPDSFAYGLEKPLSGEALYRSLLVASTGSTTLENPELKSAVIRAFPDLFPEEVISSLRQATFLTNNATLEPLLQAETVQRLARMTDASAQIQEAFQACFSRAPETDELRVATEYLKSTGASRTPAASLRQFFWSLLTSAEFRFNH